MRESGQQYNQTKYIRLDCGGLRTVEDTGLKLKKGVYY
jgi:adenylylsulfate reductase subunit B